MKKFLALVLALVFAMSLSACGAKVDLSGEIMPSDCANVIMGTPENMMRYFGLSKKDFEGETLNPAGSNRIKENAMLFGEIFNMDVSIYNDSVERITFSIDRDDPTMEDKKIFMELLEDMTEAYGEPHTNKADGRRLEYNPNYYLEEEAYIYEEWVYEDHDYQLVYTIDPEGCMHTYIVVVVHIEIEEMLEENLIKG